MFGKELSQLTCEDIQLLIDEEHQESQTLEFKSELSSEGRTTDPWIEGGGKIGDLAKRKILDEIVAFANGYGGWMFLGIEESDDEPKRAVGITPIRSCADLAVRLRHICRDLIEPQLPIIQIEGVATEDDGSGVVGFYVPRSRLAPHRNKGNRECYMRRADRSEKMTMREIQDLTIHNLRRSDDLDRLFKSRLEMGRKWFDEFLAQGDGANGALQLHLIGIPTEPLSIGRVHDRSDLQGHLSFNGQSSNGHALEAHLLRPMEEWRPVLRGTRGRYRRPNNWIEVELGDEGRVECVFAIEANQHGNFLYREWMLGLIWNALAKIQRFRTLADAPGTEYAIEIELSVVGTKLGVPDTSGYTPFECDAQFPVGRHAFVRYSIGPIEEFDQVSNLMQQDFWDLGGATKEQIYRTGFRPGVG
jgi:Schlafen, AlbA_2